MIFGRSITYTSNWYHTFFLSLILAIAIVVVLIFLQPFDIYGNEIAYKNLKMIGYGLCIVLPILIIHFLEELWFRLTHRKWHVYQELLILILGFLLISITAHLYNVLVVNDHNVNFSYVFQWMKDFALPFIPIFIPFWFYLRFRFSEVVIKPVIDEKEIFIETNNHYQELKFLEKNFILARAQSNYVDIYYLENELVKKEMIRSTLEKIKSKIPLSEQVHRSYLVNPFQIKQIFGNTRKGSITLNKMDEQVPVSPKYFLGIKKYLKNHC